MFSAPEFNPNVPAFISKLWHMLSDSSTNDLICWAKEGTSFIIHDQVKFSTELLPKYYKHNNMASFIRQLNMYGFHKVLSVDSASMKSDSNELGFSHPYFLAGHPNLLDKIKRKTKGNTRIQDYFGLLTKGLDTSVILKNNPLLRMETQDMTNSREIISDFKGDPKLVNKLLHEVQQLQNRQELFDSKLAAMKNENDALWREHSILRQKHAKQQKIVNKLIQFLVTLVQQTRGLNVKRLPLPLMIKDGGNHSSDPINLISTVQGSPSGPIICEVDPSDLGYEESENSINKLSGGRTLLITMKMQDKNLDKYIQSSGKKMKPTENITVTSLPLEDVDSANVIQKLSDSALRKSSMSTNRTLNIPKPHKTEHKRKYSVFDDDVLNTPDGPVYIEDDSPPFKRNLSDYSQIVDDTMTNGSRLHEIRQNEPADAISLIDLPHITSDDLANDTSSVNGHTDSTAHKTSEEENEFDNQCKTNDENKDLSLVPSDQYTTNALRGEIDSHLEVMQSDLDILKDILKGEGLSLDASTLLELFSSDDPMALNMTNEIQDYDNQTDESAGIGSELIAYPHLFLNDADTVKQGKVELKYPSSEMNISTNDLTNTLKQHEGSLNYTSTDLNIPTSSLDDAAQNINFLIQQNSPVKYNEP